MRWFMKRKLFVYFVIVLIVVSSFFGLNHSVRTFRSIRSRRTGDVSSLAGGHNSEPETLGEIGLYSQELSIDLTLSELTFDILVVSIKNMLTLFFVLVLMPVYPMYLYLQRWWNIAGSIHNFKFFIMHHLKIENQNQDSHYLQFQ